MNRSKVHCFLVVLLAVDMPLLARFDGCQKNKDTDQQKMRINCDVQYLIICKFLLLLHFLLHTACLCFCVGFFLFQFNWHEYFNLISKWIANCNCNAYESFHHYEWLRYANQSILTCIPFEHSHRHRMQNHPLSFRMRYSPVVHFAIGRLMRWCFFSSILPLFTFHHFSNEISRGTPSN